ncbi:MAG: amino acid ABC transporter permease [Spirochaetaceae bacterium]|jgi:L-cystine transport system permease protein|nr:amino acid ABC transporter permease [Spirochaetaceae bacterium]
MPAFDIKLLIEFFPVILSALPVTLKLAGIAAFFGLLFGALMAVVRVERVPVLRQLAAFLVSFIRGTPILIQMFVTYYGLPVLLLPLGINIMRADKMLFIYITFSLNASAFFSEMIRSAILGVPRDQWDAAQAIGHTKLQNYLRIIAPQAVVIAIPSVGVMFVSLLQDTALTIVMGVWDVLGRAQALGRHSLHLMEAYVDAAIIFVVLSFAIQQIFAYIEKKTQTKRKREK